jgi:uncharacterized membrane protein
MAKLHNKKNIFIGFTLFCLLFIQSAPVFAQSSEQVFRAKVSRVISEEPVPEFTIYGSENLQTLEITIRNTDRKGEFVEFQNDYISLKEGDAFFLGYTPSDNDGGEGYYYVIERNRTVPLLFFVMLFVLVIIAFGKKQGVRSLVALIGSMFVIIYILMPSLLKGSDPTITSVIISIIILCIAIYFTHGFKRESSIAFVGATIAITITGALSIFAVHLLQFTGLGTEEAWFLSIESQIPLNLSGLLLGGIMIGVIGVLDDIAITQTAVVRELYSSAPHLSKWDIYKRAIRVGQEHVGALVNTLALAYTGASLPLLLLVSISEQSTQVLLSKELFAVEIIRTIVGSIGLVLTVPITTLLAVYFLEKYRGQEYDGHGHSH